ncbi:MAG: hypothetical protein II936_10700, partial [Oscillospiraceae bacterium]|nr:hypothetical protein [Oscillospiraceae bacterium]
HDFENLKRYDKIFKKYDKTLELTNTDSAPWHIIPANDKLTAQVEILRKNDCRVAQGFFYDRPLPVEEFEWKLDGYNYYDK